MKVTFILPGFPFKPVGGFRVVYEYANELVRRGHEVTVYHPHFLPNHNPQRNDFLSQLRIKTSVWQKNLLQKRPSWLTIDRQVKLTYGVNVDKEKIPDGDVVIATFWATAEYVNKLPESKGKKLYLVMDFYPYLGEKEKLEKSWRLPLQKITISTWLKDIIQKSGVKGSDIIVAPCGVDLQRFKITNPLETRSPSVLMLYNDISYKAPRDGIKAMELVKDKFPQTRFICFGPKERPEDLPSWIKFEANVIDERLVELYNESSIFLSSSLAEGFAFPPAEAMACGCAVVATNSGGIREFAIHQETALLSEPGEVQQLVANLSKVLSDDQLRFQLAQAGYDNIQRFTWGKSTDLLEKMMLKV